VADATGTTVWRWDQQEPFGDSPANEDPDANSVAFDLPLRLPGQYYDAESGLHQNNFREYDPNIGRFPESDPIGLEGGINTYAYVEGSPLSSIDSLGLQSLALCANPANAAACAAAGIGPSANTAGSITRAVTTLIGGAAAASQTSSTEESHCPPDTKKPDCRKATKWDLRQAGIFDEHRYKREHGAVPESRFDICKCKDGSIRIAPVGQCGKTSDFWD